MSAHILKEEDVMPFTCPVCGYAQLTEPPKNYAICPSCGTEFGYDDFAKSHRELLFQWIQSGLPWFSRATAPPANWNPWLQLEFAGLASIQVELKPSFRHGFAPRSEKFIAVDAPLVQIT